MAADGRKRAMHNGQNWVFKKGKMNRTTSENSMFIDGISHERNIHVWVRIPNGTTVYKWASLLILPKYETPR